ncbi:phosphoenolpyruvate--protein phosphotransferase [Phytohabitans rumicis]|uniref:Phosphoenolpyruvate-protein phosphotransferase n=1 Tax=Phytohabitans rumicis TaxID=1076125 RepID=A0A6V8L3C9_9ACTN|nr:phosphoenolpyruvate--protein phosphotransferase [Phytohabitans rumicis]GFJ87215.1 phosphoenolpyruvate--protein phosphotransferase [Phytohabitans rumicis]
MPIRNLTGIGVSAGRAAGPVATMGARRPAPPEPTHVEDPGAERDRLVQSTGRVCAEMRRRAVAATGPAAEILEATAMIAEDPSWAAAAAELIEQERVAAPYAVWRSAEQFRAALAAAGGYFAERVRDLDDVRDRVIADLSGIAPPGLPDPGTPFVLVARDLAPADTATLPADRVLALVTEEGGPTSHTAILARALGIPAVVACPGVTAIADGTRVGVDGGTGEVVIEPEDADLFAAPRRDRPATVDYRGHLADGTAVALLANVGEPADAGRARSLGAAGVGLLRTEFLFGDRLTPPTLDEQVAAYAEVFAAFPGGRVVVRTLDAGSDKPLPYLTAGVETNPALGVRGLRAMRTDPELLDTQLSAVAEAARRSHTEVWTMAPMIATPAEAAEFVARARAHGLARVGAMVEVPSAALLADDLLAVVDFVSVGTNDLTQYTYAADRLVGALAALNDPWLPAVLRLIQMTGDAGRRLGKPVGVCGEAAADPLLALVLVGLGVTSLSATARMLPAVAAVLGSADQALCARLADIALRAGDPAAARRGVREAAAEAIEIV